MQLSTGAKKKSWQPLKSAGEGGFFLAMAMRAETQEQDVA